MKSDNLQKFKVIKNIESIELLDVRNTCKDLLSPERFDIAMANSRLINVYKILYKSRDHRVVGYIVEPEGDGKIPCVVWNRGGSREFGAINPEYLFTNVLAQLAIAGYFVIASQYSGNSGSEGVDEMGGSDIDDILNLYPILKKYHRADNTKIGMVGGSRGGMMTFKMLSLVKWIKAVVVTAPMVDMVSGIKFRPEMKDHYKSMFGGLKRDMISRSAFYWVDKLYKKTPILLMHGTADWRVSVLSTLEMAKKLYEEKISYRMIIFEGDDHGLSANRKEAIINTIQWLDRFVKNSERLPNLKLRGK
ncbi:MAG: prolyl oligopeptidase family serine peptidase [bacterium]|nr:prolyl oligopeptidase family serine peptidase [bacterium]